MISTLNPEEFALMVANSSFYEMTPSSMGSNIENDVVASSESIPIHLSVDPQLERLNGCIVVLRPR